MQFAEVRDITKEKNTMVWIQGKCLFVHGKLGGGLEPKTTPNEVAKDCKKYLRQLVERN